MTTTPVANPDPKLKAAEDRLREVMLSLPETTEDFPWGHRSGKVKGKMFAILVLEEAQLTVTTKLPESNAAALMLPFTAPTGYGMGKSGWVTSTFKPGQDVPVELLAQWIHESFRAVAPEKVLKAMGAGTAAKGGEAKAGVTAKKASAKNGVAKSAAPTKAPVKAGAAKKASAKNTVAKAAAAKSGAAKKAAAPRKAAPASGAAKKAASGKARASSAQRGTTAARSR
ncbi:MmcQ/YjbR family DNA-binding protein [Pyxidicoccus parkwayensis]|uniref:MmcQ/YjbR family DNA-binding protein n=1 Tax=Pyxidicoccus parkwayensis TaxID=2813578 RepID=A0ABX7NUT9_9BACT|nr:MmcQ/YjbR family DNA-binding protein [Pyxidicoccus parkwaysis]QSQ22565.1 MmcQ/YjbR family DNA-binding protein [Pyxidicoccus parkwaysis]